MHNSQSITTKLFDYSNTLNVSTVFAIVCNMTFSAFDSSWKDLIILNLVLGLNFNVSWFLLIEPVLNVLFPPWFDTSISTILKWPKNLLYLGDLVEVLIFQASREGNCYPLRLGTLNIKVQFVQILLIRFKSRVYTNIQHWRLICINIRFVLLSLFSESFKLHQ